MHDIGTDASGDTLANRFQAAAANFARHRGVDADILVQFGRAARVVRVRAGGVADIAAPAAPLPSWDFAVRGSCAAWQAFWQTVPPPGWHDIFALAKRGEMRIEGRMQLLMAHLQFVKDLLACARESGE